MYLPEIFKLGKTFQQHFQIVPAYSDALKEEVYRLRHQVYCEELKWEAVRPDRREHDEYDAHSLHVLIRSVKRGEFMGCTRLVMTRPHDRNYPLPFEKACAATLDRSIVDPATLPRDVMGEFGRLAVLGKFRNRKGEENSATGLIQTFNTIFRPRFPYILAGLYLGTIEVARLNNIDTLFILTEPRLVNHLRRLGVKIKTIGGPIEHRGQRIPSMLSVSNIISNLGFIVNPLYQTVKAEIAQGQPDSTSSMRQQKTQPGPAAKSKATTAG